MASDAVITTCEPDPFFGGEYRWDCMICGASQLYLYSEDEAREQAGEHLANDHDWLRGRYAIVRL